MFANRKAQSIMEFAIILGLISAVLIVMNTYVKRGLQGKLKDMTDTFISNEQVAEIDDTNATTNTTSNQSLKTQMFLGGSQNVRSTDHRDVESNSAVKDTSTSYRSGYIPAEEGDVSDPEIDDGIDENWPESTNIDYLVSLRERCLELSQIKFLSADQLEQSAQEVRAKKRKCRGRRRAKRRCKRAIEAAAVDLERQARETRQEAQELSDTADAIQARIDCLSAGTCT